MKRIAALGEESTVLIRDAAQKNLDYYGKLKDWDGVTIPAAQLPETLQILAFPNKGFAIFYCPN